LDYDLTYIAADFPVRSRSEFDTAYMNQMFNYACNPAKAGYPWSKYTPA
jgi:hypothetical protein